MTLQELVDKAITIATEGLADPRPVEMLADDCLSVAFQRVSELLAANHNTRGLLRRTTPITFAIGVGTVSESVFTEYLSESVLTDPADPVARYSYIDDRINFERDTETRLGKFHVDESTMRVVQPGALYSTSTGLNGSLNLTAPCAIDIPATASSVIVARGEVLDNLVSELAAELTSRATMAKGK